MPSISIAEELAKKQREISISEFFERNKQILGYDSPTKALLTAVKEAVDNSLDAANDADILPEILVEVRKTDKDEFRVVVEDNGPGIVKREVQNAIVNRHARSVYRPPEGELVVFERATEELPPKTVEIKPHPYGIELGTLLAMAKETKSHKLTGFLAEEFSRISSRVAKEICEKAGVPPEMKPKSMAVQEAKALLEAIKEV